jgi:hypothetical protein
MHPRMTPPPKALFTDSLFLDLLWLGKWPKHLQKYDVYSVLVHVLCIKGVTVQEKRSTLLQHQSTDYLVVLWLAIIAT